MIFYRMLEFRWVELKPIFYKKESDARCKGVGSKLGFRSIQSFAKYSFNSLLS